MTDAGLASSVGLRGSLGAQAVKNKTKTKTKKILFIPRINQKEYLNLTIIFINRTPKNSPMRTYIHHFPRLGLELELKDNFKIEDHRYQKSINEYFASVCIPQLFEPNRSDIHRFRDELRDFQKQQNSFGGMAEFADKTKNPNIVYFVYCYQKTDDALFNLFVQGHEEMHAYLSAFTHSRAKPPRPNWTLNTVKELKKQHPLFAENLTTYLQKNRAEILAEFGGFLTLKNYGHSVRKVHKALRKKTKNPTMRKRMDQALELILD